MYKSKIITCMLLIILITLSFKISYASDEENITSNTISIQYQSHVQYIGWQSAKKDEEISGTTGQSLRIEAMKINTTNLPEGVELKYQAHVQNIGWQSWKNEGEVAGTEGQSLGVEAIRIKLENTDKYSVQYRVHVSYAGWQDWCEDGEIAGTVGKNKRIEAIQIRIVEKQVKGTININTDLGKTVFDSDGIEISGWKLANMSDTTIETLLNGEKVKSEITYSEDSNLVSNTKGYGIESNNEKPKFNIKIDTANLATNTYTLELRLVDSQGNVITTKQNSLKLDKDTPIVKYQSHIEYIGWQEEKNNGETSGTTGESKKIEAIKIETTNLPQEVKLKYQAHVQYSGWQPWKDDGEIAGTEGQSLRLEAIRISLENTDNYSVQYRVHVGYSGWQDWCEDGEIAGTVGENKRIEAIEIRIVEKQLKGKINISTDLANITFDSDGIEFRGWKMANVPNTKIETYLNNEKIESKITYSKDENLVKNVKGYGIESNNEEPRFNIKIDTTNLEKNNYNLELKLVDNNKNIIATQSSNIKVDKNTLMVKYQSHVQYAGWQDIKKNGETSGTTNESKRLEAIKIDGVNLPKGVEIKYQAHVQYIGWQSWKNEGEIAGTEGQELRLEAIRIKLENTDKFSIQYRVHVQEVGWQDWSEDGEYAGTIGENKRIEAIQIRIVEKTFTEKTKLSIDTVGNIYNESGSIKGWVMSNVPNINIKVFFDGNQIGTATRTTRTDVLNTVKGYGGDITNPQPGFSINFDFSKQSLGSHTIKVEVWSEDNRKLKEGITTINIINRIEYGIGSYGNSGATIHGVAGGSTLRYYKYGSGPNVFFATFCVHGFEDSWAADGFILTCIADNFYNQLVASQDRGIADKWTIYIFPEVNPDGRRMGYTNNGPGRLTLYSQVGRGLDINRCWQTGSSYTRYTDSRNYNGTAGFQAYEAAALRDFMLSHKSTSGQTVVVDLHGWENQLIGNEQIANYYKAYIPTCSTRNYGVYGNQYIVSWARQNLGAKATLVEFPKANSPAQVDSMGLSSKYINATLQMLREV